MKKNKFGNIEIIKSSCNINTVKDGRGAIFTFIPEEDIVEFNMVYFQPSKIRGNHYHPEFKEYFLIVSGAIVMVTKDENGKEINMHAGPGSCFCTPPGTPHAVYAITESICISLLSKCWDKCDKAIIYEELL